MKTYTEAEYTAIVEQKESLGRQLADVTTKVQELTIRVEEAAKAKIKAEAKTMIVQRVSASKLPDAAKQRVISVLESADGETKPEDVDKAVAAEEKYIKDVAPAAKSEGEGEAKPDEKPEDTKPDDTANVSTTESVKGMGKSTPSTSPQDVTTQTESLKAMYVKRGFTPDQAEQRAKEFLGVS